MTPLMTGADSSKWVPDVPQSELNLMRRLTWLLAAIVAATAVYSSLHLLYSHKFFDVTGEARWIWTPNELSADKPVVFFAVREFNLPANRVYTRIKLLGDPEYTLYFNEQRLASRLAGEGKTLDVYDVSSLARDRRNRLIVAVRSVHGVGGLLASIDVGPETENVVVSDARWKLFTAWRDDLPLQDPAGVTPLTPRVLGEPPLGRWDYLTPQTRDFLQPVTAIAQPKDSFRFEGRLPQIVVRGGVAVMVGQPTPARAFDFGLNGLTGRLRLRLAEPAKAPVVINVRFANARDELFIVNSQVRQYTIGAGESTLDDPEVRGFRYACVYDADASVELIRQELPTR